MLILLMPRRHDDAAAIDAAFFAFLMMMPTAVADYRHELPFDEMPPPDYAIIDTPQAPPLRDKKPLPLRPSYLRAPLIIFHAATP